MSRAVCPWCHNPLVLKDDILVCSNTDCDACDEKFLHEELIRTRKENEDKQAVLNFVVDMLKTLNQKYALIMGKDVIKETVRLLEQKKGGNNE